MKLPDVVYGILQQLSFAKSLEKLKYMKAGVEELTCPLCLRTWKVGWTILKPLSVTQGRASIAKCVAALVVTQSTAEAHNVVTQFAANLKPNDASTAHQQTFSLLAIGEIGKHM